MYDDREPGADRRHDAPAEPTDPGRIPPPAAAEASPSEPVTGDPQRASSQAPGDAPPPSELEAYPAAGERPSTADESPTIPSAAGGTL
jgi:hypothetical protein